MFRGRGFRGRSRGFVFGRHEERHSNGSGSGFKPFHEGDNGSRRDEASFRGGGRPRGLRGKDIGLFFAKRSREAKSRNRSLLSMSKNQREDILDQIALLDKLEPFKWVGGGGNISFSNKYQSNLSGNLRSQSLFDTPSSSTMSVDNDPVESPSSISLEMHELFEKTKETSGYKRMQQFREKLPAFKMRRDLTNLIHSSQVVVISGETGCGKTTQVPQFILDEALTHGRGENCKIVCTQPRRISAISIAERVAEERGEMCGNGKSTVGYQIRLESKLPRERGSLLYCTTGVVLQWMRSNTDLSGISHIILDEIHERDIMSDFLITILKDILPKRPDLKVILMSATLNAEQFSKYFGKCPMINIPGFTYPVQEFYLEDVLELTGFTFGRSREASFPNKKPQPKWHKHTRKGKGEQQLVNDFEGMIEPYLRELESTRKYSYRTIESLSNPASEEINHELVASLVGHIHNKEGEGAILVFLPGWDDIAKVNKLLTEDHHFQLKGKFKIYPLHSLMPTVSQKDIFEKPPARTRKIVIATNIAETSITIDDVVYVVDCGKIKMTNFDISANISTLKPEWVALANARQRRGRAGRVQPGICYHLYTRAREMILSQFVVPEMLRTRLEEVILQIKVLELGKASQFLSKVMEPPSEDALELAVSMLQTINALDNEEQLTPMGFHLAHLPMDPQTAKMILLGSIFSCLDPILSVAASLSFKDAFVVPLGKESLVDRQKLELSRNSHSDHLMLANVIKEWERAVAHNQGRQFCWDNFLSESTLKMLTRMKSQFAEYLHSMQFLRSKDCKAAEANKNSSNEDLVRAIICAGLYPNIAHVKMKKRYPILETETERRVNIHPKSVNSKETHFKYAYMAYHLKMKSSSTFLYDTTVVSPMALIFFGRYLRCGEEILEDRTIIETINVDNFVKFNCSSNTSVLFKDLRKSLDELLEWKVVNPGITNWNLDKKEGALLKTIGNLLSIQPQGSNVEEDCD